MNKITRESVDEYYKEAESWARDRQEGLRKSQRIAWWIASGAAAIALLEAIALVVLTPLKTVVPYTLLVDKQTGFVQALRPLDAEKVAPDAALTQSFLVQYVIARESYDADSIQADYRRVALWSAEKARAEYLTRMQANNPQSPVQMYPRSTVVEARVKSVSTLGPRVSMVRFDTVRRDAGGQETMLGSWAVVLRYRFTTEPLSAADRFLNPLGFQVLRYERSAETVPASQPTTVLTPVPTTTTTTTVVPIPGPSTTTTVILPGQPTPVQTRVMPAPRPAPTPPRPARAAPRPDEEL
jgi:type IV secretion system protein VirB8